MISGMKVRSLSESGSYTFVSLETEGVECRLTFKSGDPRIQEFGFGSEKCVEISDTVTNPIRLIK